MTVGRFTCNECGESKNSSSFRVNGKGYRIAAGKIKDNPIIAQRLADYLKGKVQYENADVGSAVGQA